MGDKPEFSLPFSEEKQRAVVGFMLTNEKFYKTTCSKIEPSWFLSVKCGELVDILKKYYNEYKFFPTIPSFLGYREFMAMDLRKSNELKNLATVCVSSAASFRQEEVKRDLSEWFEATTLMAAMTKASRSYNQKDIKSTYLVLNEAVKEVNHGYFNDSSEMDFINYEAYLKDFERQKEGALTTGLSILDKAILKDAKGGCLLPGDSTIILSPVNIGKSTAMISIACHNIRRGKSVLFLTHEGSPDYIRLMFVANVIGCTTNDLQFMATTPEGNNRIKEATALIARNLTYIPYNKAGNMVVEDVIPIVNQYQEARKAEFGRGYDLLVDDYPQVLSSTLAYKGTLQKRNIDQIVYGGFIQLALEHKFHFLGAIQTNRDGSKINKHHSGATRLLVPEDVSESFAVIMMASNVLTLNRSPQAEKLGIATFSVGKTRTNKKGIAVIFKTNYEHCQTHSNELGGMAYFGVNSIENQFEKLFPRFKNEEITDDIRAAF